MEMPYCIVLTKNRIGLRIADVVNSELFNIPPGVCQR